MEVNTVLLAVSQYDELKEKAKAFDQFMTSGEVFQMWGRYNGAMLIYTKDDAIKKMTADFNSQNDTIVTAVQKIDNMLKSAADDRKFDLYKELRGLRFNVLLGYLPDNYNMHK